MSSAAASLLIGVPSLAIAALTFWFATRAHRQQMAAAGARETSAGIAAEAGAYTRAQAIDEAVIAELRRRIDSLRAEVDHLTAELAATRTQLQQAQAVIDELRSTVAMFRPGGQLTAGAGRVLDRPARASVPCERHVQALG